MYLGWGENRTHFQWEKNYECLGYVMKKIGVSLGGGGGGGGHMLLLRLNNC